MNLYCATAALCVRVNSSYCRDQIELVFSFLSHIYMKRSSFCTYQHLKIKVKGGERKLLCHIHHLAFASTLAYFPQWRCTSCRILRFIKKKQKKFPISFSPFQLFVYESRFEKFVRMSWLKGIPKLRNCFANQLSCRHDNLKARVCVNWKAIGSHFLFSFTLDFHVYVFLPMREFSSLCDCKASLRVVEGFYRE